jgi:hypothetical protein
MTNGTVEIERRPTAANNHIPPHNVIIFGETGAGKSSVINMICGHNTAKTSNEAAGCTFSSTPHEALLPDNSPITFWDTAGLGEGDKGTVTAKDAIVSLYKLICMLDGGVCLLVYCMRGPRIKESLVKNYQMFYSAFCMEKVPIVLVVTGLEEELELNDWWSRNAAEFQRYGMQFAGHACITSTKGKDGVYQKEYDSSALVTRVLVNDHYLRTPWKMESRTGWLTVALKAMGTISEVLFDFPIPAYQGVLVQALKDVGGLTAKQAHKIAKDVMAELGKRPRFSLKYFFNKS